MPAILYHRPEADLPAHLLCDKITNEFFSAVRFVLAATIFSRIIIIASSSSSSLACEDAGRYAVGYFLPRLDCYVSRYSHTVITTPEPSAFSGTVLHEKLIGVS